MLCFLTTLACRCTHTGTSACNAKLIMIQEFEDRPDPRDADYSYVHGDIAFRASVLTETRRRRHWWVRSGPDGTRVEARY